MTLLTREGSTSAPPAGIAGTKQVDYKSVESLTAALQGQDAVVSVLGSLAAGEQKPLVDAAVAPGSTIQRFIPSEFGINTRQTPGSTIGKILAAKTATVDYLIEQTKAHPTLKWTGLSVGHFFDWGIPKGALGFNAKARTATIYDSGNEPVQASNLPYIGRAVVAVLQQAGTEKDKTANQYIQVASFTPTQNEILALAEELTGGAKWTVERVSTADKQKLGEDKLGRGDFSAFGDLLAAWQFADGAGRAPNLADPASGNQLLGLAPEDLKASVAAWLKG